MQLPKRILSDGFDFTAIATFNDYLAIGAMKATFERNLKIPDDIEFASLSIVPLTTVRLPKYLLGSKTAEVLLTKMTKQKIKPHHILLKPELVVRNST